jgi:hypothetical protein
MPDWRAEIDEGIYCVTDNLGIIVYSGLLKFLVGGLESIRESDER